MAGIALEYLYGFHALDVLAPCTKGGGGALVRSGSSESGGLAMGQRRGRDEPYSRKVDIIIKSCLSVIYICVFGTCDFALGIRISFAFTYTMEMEEGAPKWFRPN